MKRDSFIFYRSFFEAITELSEDDQILIYKSIAEYSLNFKEIKLKGVAKTIFILIKPQLDANNKRFINGLQPKKKQKGSKPEANIKQDESKPEANNNVNDNVNVNNNVNDNIISIFDSIKKHIPKENYTLSEYNKCLDTIDKLIRLDGYTEKQIIDTISNKDKSFYGKNIQSIQALRNKKDGLTKFDKLYNYTKDINNNNPTHVTYQLKGLDKYTCTVDEYEKNKHMLSHSEFTKQPEYICK